MLYIVECAYSDPAHEQAWNDYYSGQKLAEILAAPGFRSSQRFKAINPIRAPYLAIHTIDSPEVMTSAAYKALGGGKFDDTYQRYVINWTRNLFTGIDYAPAIPMDEFIAMTDRTPDEVKDAGVEFTWLKIAGLDATTPQRGIARIGSSDAQRLSKHYSGVINVFKPTMPQRRELPGKY